jgi:hypothetical protein
MESMQSNSKERSLQLEGGKPDLETKFQEETISHHLSNNRKPEKSKNCKKLYRRSENLKTKKSKLYL